MTNPDAPVAVLVHGMAVSSRYMVPLAQSLAKTHTVYALDLPGVGASSRPSQPIGIEESARILARWLEVVDLDNVVLVANSFGSQVSVETASLCPERLSSVVLMGPTANVDSPGRRMHVLKLAASLWREPWWFVPVALRDLADCGPKAAWHSLRVLSQHSILDALSSVPDTVPVHIARGRHDLVSSAKWCQRLADAAGTGVVHTIDNAAHIAHGLRPNEMASTIVRVSNQQSNDASLAS